MTDVGHEADSPNLGAVTSVRGSVVDIRFDGPLARGMAVEDSGGPRFPGDVLGIAFNVDADEIGVVLLGEYWHLHTGDEVRRTGRVMDVAVGDGLLGRVIDPLGRPLDGNGALAARERLLIERPAAPIMDRAPVTAAGARHAPAPRTRRRIADRAAHHRNRGAEHFRLHSEGVLPAVDVGKSVSRVGGKAQRAAYRAVAGDLKLAYAQFEELETFARFGARLDENTRKVIEHGRRIRACLKQPEFAPASVPAQIAILLALTAELFDPVPLEQMTDAEHAVHEAAANIPAEVCARFETADKLSEEDRKSIVDIARKALAGFQPRTSLERHHGEPAAQDRQCRRSAVCRPLDESPGRLECRPI